MGADEIRTRVALVGDVPFLWRMLAFAASMEGTAEDVARARTDPALRDYVEGFGRDGDVGAVALIDGEPVGSAWVRLAPPGPISDTKVWSEAVPELAIAIVPEVRGRGVGTRLLAAIIELARAEHASIALSVREENPAVRLYERMGFTVQRRMPNRVGTSSLVMCRTL